MDPLKAMFRLADLPIDIVDLVIANIKRQGDRCALALSSRWLHTLVTPHLYRDIYLHDVDYLNEARHKKLRKFGVTVLNNAYIASCVRGFAFDYRADIALFRKPTDAPRTRRQVALEAEYQAAIDAPSLDRAEAIREHLAPPKRTNVDVLLAILLPKLSQLERLFVVIPPYSKYFERMMHCAASKEKPFNTQASFSTLKQVFIVYSRAGDGDQSFAPYFNLPALTAIHACHFAKEYPYLSLHPCGVFPCPSLEPASSAVTHLELRHCMLIGRGLAHMIRACRSLKSFIYVHGCGTFPFEPLKASEVRSALVSAEDTLEVLWLDYKNEERRIDDILLHHNREGKHDLEPIPFAEFQTLKDLTIGMLFLFGGDPEWKRRRGDDDERPEVASVKLVEQLPFSLERLHIRHCSGLVRSLIFHLEELLKRREEMPLLKEISMEVPADGGWEDYDCTLLDSLAEAGDVRIRKLSASQQMPSV